MTFSVSAPTNNTGALLNNGTEVLSVESDNSINIDSNTLYVDATNNRVGVGTSNPITPIHTVQTGQSSIAYFNNINASWAGDVQVAYSPSGTTVSTLGFSARSDGSTWLTSNYGNMLFITGTSGSGSERMRIDTNGVVSMSNQPYFYAERSSSLTVNPSNQTEAIVYDSVTRNIGNCYNGSTGLFTAPVSGIYAFTVSVYGFTFSQLWAIQNGTRTTSFYLGSTTNNAGSFTKYLNANDTLGVHAYDGASSGTILVNQHHTYFEGGLIG